MINTRILLVSLPTFSSVHVYLFLFAANSNIGNLYFISSVQLVYNACFYHLVLIGFIKLDILLTIVDLYGIHFPTILVKDAL